MDGGGLVMARVRALRSTPITGHAPGFTLVELVVTLAILVIVTSIAVPSFQSMILGGRVSTVTTDLHSALVLARSEAVKRNGTVVVSAAGEWSDGWVITAADGTALGGQAVPPGINIDGSASSATFSGSGRAMAAVDFTVTAEEDETKFGYLCLGVDGRAESGKEEC